MGGRKEGRGGETEGREKRREGEGGGTCSKVLGGIDAPGIPQYFGWGDVNGNIPQYYYVLSDIADQY